MTLLIHNKERYLKRKVPVGHAIDPFILPFALNFIEVVCSQAAIHSRESRNKLKFKSNHLEKSENKRLASQKSNQKHSIG